MMASHEPRGLHQQASLYAGKPPEAPEPDTAGPWQGQLEQMKEGVMAPVRTLLQGREAARQLMKPAQEALTPGPEFPGFGGPRFRGVVQGIAGLPAQIIAPETLEAGAAAMAGVPHPAIRGLFAGLIGKGLAQQAPQAVPALINGTPDEQRQAAAGLAGGVAGLGMLAAPEIAAPFRNESAAVEHGTPMPEYAEPSGLPRVTPEEPLRALPEPQAAPPLEPPLPPDAARVAETAAQEPQQRAPKARPADVFGIDIDGETPVNPKPEPWEPGAGEAAPEPVAARSPLDAAREMLEIVKQKGDPKEIRTWERRVREFEADEAGAGGHEMPTPEEMPPIPSQPYTARKGGKRAGMPEEERPIVGYGEPPGIGESLGAASAESMSREATAPQTAPRQPRRFLGLRLPNWITPGLGDITKGPEGGKIAEHIAEIENASRTAKLKHAVTRRTADEIFAKLGEDGGFAAWDAWRSNEQLKGTIDRYEGWAERARAIDPKDTEAAKALTDEIKAYAEAGKKILSGRAARAQEALKAATKADPAAVAELETKAEGLGTSVAALDEGLQHLGNLAEPSTQRWIALMGKAMAQWVGRFGGFPEDAATRPAYQEMLDWYKKNIGDPQGELFEAAGGTPIAEEYLGEGGSHYPLMRESWIPQETRARFKRLPFSKPKPVESRMRTGLSEDYTLKDEAHINRTAAFTRTAHRAMLRQTLVDNGWAKVLAPRENIDTLKYNGQDVPVVIEKAGDDFLLPKKGGGWQRVSGQRVAVAKPVHDALAEILEGKPPQDPGLWSKITTAITESTLLGLADETYNLTRVARRTAGYFAKFKDIVDPRKAIMNTIRVRDFDPLAPENLEFSEKVIADGSTSRRVLSGNRDAARAKMLNVPHTPLRFSRNIPDTLRSIRDWMESTSGEMELRAKAKAYKLMKEIDPEGYKDWNQRTRVADQFYGVYSKSLASPVERFAKASAMGPFASSGASRVRTGLRSWTEIPKGVESKAMYAVTNHPLAALALFYAGFYAVNGRWFDPAKDKLWRFFKNEPDDSYANSLAKNMGNMVSGQGRTSFGALGLNSVIQDLAGGEPQYIPSDVPREMANTWGRLVAGPPAAALERTLTGRELSLTRGGRGEPPWTLFKKKSGYASNPAQAALQHILWGITADVPIVPDVLEKVGLVPTDKPQSTGGRLPPPHPKPPKRRFAQ